MKPWRRLFVLLSLGILCPVLAQAQFTTVTGTVTDPNGLPYANGTISFRLVPATASPTLSGLSYSPPIGPAQLDGTGTFTVRLADNNQLSPAGTQWQFTVCGAPIPPPLGFGGAACFTSAGITITGASQSITTQLNGAAIAQSRNALGGFVFVDGVRYTTIQAAHDFLPSSGGTIYVTPSGAATAFNTALTITKPIRVIFDDATYTFSGTGSMVSCTTGTEAVRFSGSNRGGTSTTQGSILSVTNTSANGVNATNCPGLELDHFSVVGPGSGTGKGIILGGTRLKLDHVYATAFGSDGVTIDGSVVNTNVGVCIGSRSSNNGGHGWKILGTNANVWTFAGCEGAGNTLDGFNIATSGHSFLATNTSANASAIGYHFLSGGSNNYFSGFSDAPNAPETTAIQFDAGANNNEIHCGTANMPINTDNGSGNRYYNCGGTAGAGGSFWNIVNANLFRPAGVTFASLGADANGSIRYCTDCNATCTAGGGTGRTCFRENGAWTH